MFRKATKGQETRERLLAIAEASVLAKGFAATSIEEVIAEAGITKSGFFYHFGDKNALAHEMLLRYVAADLPNGHPGCLIASVCYQERLFDQTVRQLTAESVRKWNAFFRERIEAIAAAYPPVEPVDLDQLAGMMSCIVDGGIIMSKALEDPAILPQQVLLFRSYIKLLFQR